jgi:hypothetical protein
MNLKQKLSILAGSVLPALALVSYLLLVPATTIAASCPPGEIFTPGCPLNSNRCNDGHSGCTVPAGHKGVFVFCSGSGFNGTCVSTACVKCD